jgi:hypothetical protein
MIVFKMGVPSGKQEKAYLNLINLPVNELCNTVPVIKLEFDRPLSEIIQPSSPQNGNSGWVFG